MMKFSKTTSDSSEDIKILPKDLGVCAEQIMECDRIIKDAKIHKDICMDKLKEAMGNHVSAKVNDYNLNWGFITYQAQPEKVVPAKAARTIRKKSINIKKV